MSHLWKNSLFLLLIVLIIFAGCNDDEPATSGIKRIKEIEVDQSVYSFNYENNQVSSIDVDGINFDFKYVFEYDEQGRISRSTTFVNDTSMQSERIITFLNSGEVRMRYHYTSTSSYEIFYINGNQNRKYIEKIESCSENQEDWFLSVTYQPEFDGDNLMKQTILMGEEQRVYREFEFTYDGQYSPLFPYQSTLGILNIIDGLDPFIFNFSRNNITKIRDRRYNENSDSFVWISDFRYDYDDEGYPVKAEDLDRPHRTTFYRWEKVQIDAE